MKTRKQYTAEEKANAVTAAKSGEKVGDVAKRLGTHYTTVYQWMANAAGRPKTKRARARVETPKPVLAPKRVARRAKRKAVAAYDVRVTRKAKLALGEGVDLMSAHRAVCDALSTIPVGKREQVLTSILMLIQ